jgi:serine/threonine-protein kinase
VPPLSPGLTFADYRLDALVSRGGMGEVWRATKRGADGWEKTVALKVILPHFSADERFAAMFLAEAKIAAALDHVNVVPVFGFGRVGDHVYLEMELVDGLDLARLLARTGRGLPLGLALYIVAEVLKALDYAHRQGFVHRDVKPHNVLISRHGAVKLSDFGIAKAGSERSASNSEVKGTAGYIAPEVLRGERASSRSDLFGVGLIAWECLTGERLFHGQTEAERLTRTLECRVPPLTDAEVVAPPQVEALVTRLLARDPNARFASAAEALQALLASPGGRAATSVELQALVATVPPAQPIVARTGSVAGEAKPTSFAARLDRSLGTRRVVLGLGAAAAASVLALLLLRPGPQGVPEPPSPASEGQPQDGVPARSPALDPSAPNAAASAPGAAASALGAGAGPGGPRGPGAHRPGDDPAVDIVSGGGGPPRPGSARGSVGPAIAPLPVGAPKTEPPRPAREPSLGASPDAGSATVPPRGRKPDDGEGTILPE